MMSIVNRAGALPPNIRLTFVSKPIAVQSLQCVDERVDFNESAAPAATPPATPPATPSRFPSLLDETELALTIEMPPALFAAEWFEQEQRLEALERCLLAR